MGERIIDPFSQLLNKINYELTSKDLQGLVHICGKHLRGREKENIKNGLDLFECLQRKGIISHDKVANLWWFIMKMLPKPVRIVDLVENYIKKEHHTDDLRLVLHEVLQDMSESYESRAFSSDGPQVTNHERFKRDNEYMYCVCRKSSSCYVILGIPVFLFIVVASVVWFAESPKDLHPYIIGAACVLFFFIVGCYLCKKCTCKSCHRRGYENIVNSTVQLVESGEQIVTSEAGRVAAEPRAYDNKYGCASSADSVGISVRPVLGSVSSAEVV